LGKKDIDLLPPLTAGRGRWNEKGRKLHFKILSVVKALSSRGKEIRVLA